MKPQIGSALANLVAQGARTGKVDAAQARLTIRNNVGSTSEIGTHFNNLTVTQS